MKKLLSQKHYVFESLSPEALLTQEDLSIIEDFSFSAFCEQNVPVSEAYAQSTNKDEFKALFNEQISMGLDLIRQANQVKPSSGFVIVAREDDAKGKPVGFLIAIRNGNQLQTHEYYDKVNISTCGLSNMFNTAFGPVMQEFNMEAIGKFDNILMVGLTAVHPKHMRSGVASEMYNKLSEVVKATGYEGAYTILTTKNAQIMFEKMAGKDHLIFLDNGSIRFIGYAFDVQNRPSLEAINSQCRNTPSIAAKIENAGGSPIMTRADHYSQDATQTEQKTL